MEGREPSTTEKPLPRPRHKNNSIKVTNISVPSTHQDVTNLNNNNMVSSMFHRQGKYLSLKLSLKHGKNNVHALEF